jgi:ABC-type Fe3+ transport system substrate-binding protein
MIMAIDRGRFLGLCTAAPLAFAPALAHAQTIDELYQKARQEGALSLYTGGPAANYTGPLADFKAKYPGITVTVTGDFSNVIDRKVDTELAQNNVVCDIPILQTVQDFVRWNAAGALTPYKPAFFDAIGPEFREPSGAYFSQDVFLLAYSYNTTMVRPDDVPSSALDFLKPQFRGLAVTCYPHDDDATLYLFSTLVKKYGWSFMDRYMANDARFVQGHVAVSRDIAAGKSSVTFDASSHTSDRLRLGGQPIANAFSRDDLTPVFTTTAGIMKRAPHPNAAKLYTNWYLSPEQQARTGNWSPRNDLPPPPGLRPLNTYHLANAYREFVTDEANLIALRKRFLAYTGPVVNK